MSFYKKQEKLDYYSAAIELKYLIPSLKKESAEDIQDYLRGSGLSIYKDKKIKTSGWFRLTLIPAIILLFIFFLCLPINYIITGKWNYEWLWLTNWTRKLGL